MNRKDKTEAFALRALGYCLVILEVLSVLSSLVSCEKEPLETPPIVVELIDYSKPYDEIRNNNDIWIL